jgi:SAM-dependent methyltransferase
MGVAVENETLQHAWARQETVRFRVNPTASDPEYLVLADLRMFLDRFATTEPIRILDYGAGASPYRELFPKAEYRRADLVPGPDLDYLLPADSSLPDGIGEFDLVLSTQVAEHLTFPEKYFREGWRVLKPGGVFVITTHGTWEEHGAPYDFQRWTTLGLDRDLRAAGLPGAEFYKLTAGHRAYLFLFLRWMQRIHSRRSFLDKAGAGVLRRIAARLQPGLHRWSDRRFPELRVVGPKHDDTDPFYMVLAAVVRKPPPQ